ncbi:Methylated-DNA--protein-cysteine methyltransferase [Janthinobacterium sp. CG23_2]|nr:Methylated-DNA--protein-cysteine methyltransferase [Janthinobacterium sp. CG23_2]CUU33574.1 Methylated-DNA--protein-cysteine methyltransferase [Janthinobacterium sp. CG23_2]
MNKIWNAPQGAFFFVCRKARRIGLAPSLRYTAYMNNPAADIFSAIVAAPFGGIGIRTEAARVRELVYLPPHFGEKNPLDPVAELAARQVGQYLLDPDFRFDLPLLEAGSAFQRRVWEAISAIPRGTVRTYGQVAKHIGSAPRAVGQACGANWFPIIIPCHRVTAAGGLGGFSNHDDENGFHLSVKRWLLAHEGAGKGPWQQQSIFN